MRDMQGYIGVRSPENNYEMGDVPDGQMRLYTSRYQKPVHSDVRVPHTRWVVLRYPTPSMAQQAHMSTEAFEAHYFNVCNLDYAKMSRAMDALVALLEKTDRVHIVGPGTDLSFSIRGLPAVKCDGRLNIPDGEVFTAPVRESVNGTLHINAPSLYNGTTFSDIRMTFCDGKIVEATSNDPVRQNAILDTDEGARYIGEFAIGVNPYIHSAIMDTLFDEKIAGSFHFTPGQLLRRMQQRQPQRHPLGFGVHPDPGIRRRRNVLRRRAGAQGRPVRLRGPAGAQSGEPAVAADRMPQKGFPADKETCYFFRKPRGKRLHFYRLLGTISHGKSKAS